MMPVMEHTMDVRVIRVKENSDGSSALISNTKIHRTPFMTITENELNNKIDNGEIAILDIVKKLSIGSSDEKGKRVY